MNWFILVGGWFIYFVFHSLLASARVKAMVAQSVGKNFRFYRLFYSVISLAGLVFLLVVNASIPSPMFFGNDGIVRYLSLMFTTFGVMTIQLSFRQYNFSSFLGFGSEGSELKRDGILNVVRHPIYSGLILITIGFFLFIPNLPTAASCACIIAYIPIGMYLEEKKLVKEFGDQYRQYQAEVPALIPKLPLKS